MKTSPEDIANMPMMYEQRHEENQYVRNNYRVKGKRTYELSKNEFLSILRNHLCESGLETGRTAMVGFEQYKCGEHVRITVEDL